MSESSIDATQQNPNWHIRAFSLLIFGHLSSFLRTAVCKRTFTFSVPYNTSLLSVGISNNTVSRISWPDIQRWNNLSSDLDFLLLWKDDWRTLF